MVLWLYKMSRLSINTHFLTVECGSVCRLLLAPSQRFLIILAQTRLKSHFSRGGPQALSIFHARTAVRPPMARCGWRLKRTISPSRMCRSTMSPVFKLSAILVAREYSEILRANQGEAQNHQMVIGH